MVIPSCILLIGSVEHQRRILGEISDVVIRITISHVSIVDHGSQGLLGFLILGRLLGYGSVNLEDNGNYSSIVGTCSSINITKVSPSTGAKEPTLSGEYGNYFVLAGRSTLLLVARVVAAWLSTWLGGMEKFLKCRDYMFYCIIMLPLKKKLYIFGFGSPSPDHAL